MSHTVYSKNIISLSFEIVIFRVFLSTIFFLPYLFIRALGASIRKEGKAGERIREREREEKSEREGMGKSLLLLGISGTTPDSHFSTSTYFGFSL